MNTAQISPDASRALASVRVRLLWRQVLRAAAYGVLTGSSLAGLAVLFATVLPQALVGVSAAALPAALVAGVLGCATGIGMAMRGYHVPDALDCALVLEASDAQGGAALVTLLNLGEGSPFAPALKNPAGAELARRRVLKLAPALPLWLILAVPVAALGAALISAAAVNMSRGEVIIAGFGADAPRANVLDLASARTEADAAAFAAAAKMTKAAADMKNAAGTLKDSAASAESREKALAQAGRAATTANTLAGGTPETVPRELPATEAEVQELVAKLEAAAGRYVEIARDFETGKRSATGTSDRPTSDDDYRRVMAPFPAYEGRAGLAGMDILTAQSMARRQIAQRAVELAGK